MAGIAIHGMISAGTAKNRVYAAYGTGANGVIQILDRKKLLTAFENPVKPTTEEMLAPQVGYLTMSPDQGAHTTFPIFSEPIPEFQGHAALKNSRPSDRSLGIVARAIIARRGPAATARRRTWHFSSTSATKPLPGLFRHSACRKILEISAARAGGSAHIRLPNRFILLTTERSRFFHGLMRAFACLIFATLCRARGRLFHSCAEQVHHGVLPADGVSHPAGDPKITSECQKVIETNNVEVDDRGLIYSADRAGSGLHIMRLTGHAKEIVAGK